jgi:hypothetical protein
MRSKVVERAELREIATELMEGEWRWLVCR